MLSEAFPNPHKLCDSVDCAVCDLPTAGAEAALTACAGGCRGKEKHVGVDVICADGSDVFAPFSGELSGPIRFFHSGNAIDDGVQIRGEGK